MGRWLGIGAVVVLALGGCAQKQLEAGLTSRVGTNVNSLFNTIGMPQQEKTIAGQKVYVWANQQTNTMFMPTTTTTGYVGMTPYTATNYTPMQMNASCVIEVAVDDSNRITRWQFNGNEAGCGPYASRLRQ